MAFRVSVNSKWTFSTRQPACSGGIHWCPQNSVWRPLVPGHTRVYPATRWRPGHGPQQAFLSRRGSSNAWRHVQSSRGDCTVCTVCLQAASQPGAHVFLQHGGSVHSAHDPKDIHEVGDSRLLAMSGLPQIQDVIRRAGFGREVVNVPAHTQTQTASGMQQFLHQYRQRPKSRIIYPQKIGTFVEWRINGGKCKQKNFFLFLFF